MTRKRTTGVLWRAITGYGELGDLMWRNVLLPAQHRARYLVRVFGRLNPYHVGRVTVTDHTCGASLTFEDGQDVVASLPASLKPDDVARLWRDAGYLAGWVTASGGRPNEAAGRLADYRSAILALGRDKGYRPGQITARLVLQRLHRTGSEAQLRKDVAPHDIGGWRAFRAEVLRGQ